LQRPIHQIGYLLHRDKLQCSAWASTGFDAKPTKDALHHGAQPSDGDSRLSRFSTSIPRISSIDKVKCSNGVDIHQWPKLDIGKDKRDNDNHLQAAECAQEQEAP
jgi:hypothetical protein